MFEHKLLKIDRYQSVYVQKMTQVEDDFCYNLWFNLFSNEYEEWAKFQLLDKWWRFEAKVEKIDEKIAFLLLIYHKIKWNSNMNMNK
jgi:hypothetical protein